MTDYAYDAACRCLKMYALGLYLFTGKERDTESGNDYFEARYYSSNMGRFMSPDPSTLSERLANPQTWNRYTYALNSPLIIDDPTGELWNYDRDGSGPQWTNTCGFTDDCVKTFATSNSNSVTAYGTDGPSDVTTYNANKSGYVDVSQMTSNSGADFSFQPGVTNTFASPQTAAGLFNATAAYGDVHPGDSKISLNDIGSANGSPIAPHQTHDHGRAADMRYMDSNGHTVNNVMRADDGRMADLIGDFQRAGFNQIYSDNNVSYGVLWAPGHENHIHMGKTAATSREEIEKNTPPSQ
jgi:RHS repeat-associated protein